MNDKDLTILFELLTRIGELLEEINKNFPGLTIFINGNPQFFLTFKDFNNEVICRYIASKGSTPLDPTKNQIPGFDKTPAQVLDHLNSKPGEDNFKYEEDDEGEKDTRYIFDRWEGLPEKVTESLVLSPLYKTEYLLKFFYGTNRIVPNDIWVTKGENAQDPREISDNYIVQKEPDANFSYIHSGWDKSLQNISRATNYQAAFTSIVNTYEVVFYTNLVNQITKEPIPIEVRSKVPYGETIPDVADSKKVFYINGNIETPSNLHNFEKWVCDTPGVEGLTITPKEYQETPISMTASFIFTGDKNDTHWKYIALVAAAGNQEVEITAENCVNEEDIGKIIPPIHTSSIKDVFFNYGGQEYTVTMEVVAQNFDQLAETSPDYNHGSDRAVFSFLAKDISIQKELNVT